MSDWKVVLSHSDLMAVLTLAVSAVDCVGGGGGGGGGVCC